MDGTDPPGELIQKATSVLRVGGERVGDFHQEGAGKLTAPDDLEHQVQSGGFLPLSVSIAHGLAAGQLARHHDDPFDRMLIAQAQAESLTIVTRDKRFSDYGIALLTAD